MKRNTIIIWILLPAVAMMCAAAVKAQEFNSNESIREQLKKGTVPGLRYGTAPAPKKLESGRYQEGQGSSIAELRNGTAKGVLFAKGGSGSARSSANRSNAGTGKRGALSSEQPASNGIQKRSLDGAALPTQGNIKEPDIMYKAPAIRNVPAERRNNEGEGKKEPVKKQE